VINAGELDLLRSFVTARLPDQCDINRITGTTENEQGGEEPTWTEVTSNVACSAAQRDLAPIERVIGGRVINEITWTVILPAGTDVTAKDRLVVTILSLAGNPTINLEVLAVGGPMTYEVQRRVICIEVK